MAFKNVVSGRVVCIVVLSVVIFGRTSVAVVALV